MCLKEYCGHLIKSFFLPIRFHWLQIFFKLRLLWRIFLIIIKIIIIIIFIIISPERSEGLYTSMRHNKNVRMSARSLIESIIFIGSCCWSCTTYSPITWKKNGEIPENRITGVWLYSMMYHCITNDYLNILIFF
jgi:hypothetical protein